MSKNADDKIIALKIGSFDNLTIEKIFIENADFWNSLPFKENENLFKNTKDEL